MITALQADFERYGEPQEILTDNATAFTSVWQDSVGQLTDYLDSVGIKHKLISAYYPESNGKVADPSTWRAEAFIKILSTECLQITEFADLQEIETFVAQFVTPLETCTLFNSDLHTVTVSNGVTYYNQYRAHGGVGYKPPVWWYAGDSPKVKGLCWLWGLEAVAQQWSGESSAEAPIVVTKEELARRKALVLVA